MNGYGYDPIRIEMLRTRTYEAIDALGSIRSDDPLAADALHAVALMRQNLEETWIPLVEAIHSSTAMVTWRRAVGLATGFATLTSSLADRIDALTSWIGSAGLEHLDDTELAERLGDAATSFVDAARSGDGLLPAWAHIDQLAAETARRLDDDHHGRFTELVRTALGPGGVGQIVTVVDTAGEITDLDLMAGTTDTRAANGRLQVSLGTILGRVASTDTTAHDQLVELAPHSSHLADTAAASPEAFDGPLLVALTVELVAYTSGTGHWSSRPRQADRYGSAGTLLATVARSPGWSLQLLADPAVLQAITTDRHHHDDSVEAIVAAALGAAAGDVELLGDGLEVLADLVGVTARSELNVGTRRGVALSIGVYLPAISIQLVPSLPVDVPLPAIDPATDPGTDRGTDPGTGTGTIRLGSYDDVERFLGQVVDDEAAQLALGVTVGSFRVDQASRAMATIRARPDFDARAAGVQLAADLAGVSRVIRTVTSAIDQRNELLAFRHGLAQAEASTVVSLVDTAVSTLPGVGTAAARISRMSTRGLLAAIGRTTPSTVPDTGLDAELRMHFTVTALAVPLHHTDLRRRFGVDRVPAATWQRLEELSDELADADDPDHRSVVHSRILRLVDDTPDLQIYMTEVGVLSGDTTLD